MQQKSEGKHIKQQLWPLKVKKFQLDLSIPTTLANS